MKKLHMITDGEDGRLDKLIAMFDRLIAEKKRHEEIQKRVEELKKKKNLDKFHVKQYIDSAR